MLEIARRIAWIAVLAVPATLSAAWPSAALAQEPTPAATGGPGQAAGGRNAAGGNGGGRIGIGTIGPATLAADLRIKIEDAAAAALTAAGADVVTAAELARARTNAALGGCADSVCEQRLAQITYTQYWLRGVCQMDTSSYRLHFELVDARSGGVLASRDDTCDICTEADVAETTRVAAQALKETLARSQVAPGSSGPSDGAAATVIDGRERDAGSRKPAWQRVLPWVAFVAAAGAVGGGVYALTLNGQGKGDCSPPGSNWCRDNYRTIWLGVPLIGLGAALAAAGIVVLALPAPGSTADAQAASANGPDPSRSPPTSSLSAAVVVSPGTIGVVGSF